MPTVILFAFGISSATKSIPHRETQQEHRIAAQAIKAADNQLGAVASASIQRVLQFRPVAVALAALDLDDLLDQFPMPPFSQASTAARCAFRPSPDSCCFFVETRM